VAQFWLAHHRVFRQVAGHHEGLAWWNFAFLFTITAMPFTSSLLGNYGSNPLAVDIFALNVLLAALATQATLLFGQRRDVLIAPTDTEVRATRARLNACNQQVRPAERIVAVDDEPDAVWENVQAQQQGGNMRSLPGTPPAIIEASRMANPAHTHSATAAPRTPQRRITSCVSGYPQALSPRTMDPIARFIASPLPARRSPARCHPSHLHHRAKGPTDSDRHLQLQTAGQPTGTQQHSPCARLIKQALGPGIQPEGFQRYVLAMVRHPLGISYLAGRLSPGRSLLDGSRAEHSLISVPRLGCVSETHHDRGSRTSIWSSSALTCSSDPIVTGTLATVSGTGRDHKLATLALKD